MVRNEWLTGQPYSTQKGSQVQAPFTNALVRFLRHVNTTEMEVLHMWHLAKGKHSKHAAEDTMIRTDRDKR